MSESKPTHTENIVAELKKRERLALIVDAILKRHLITVRKKRIRRGIVHTLVADEMGWTESNRLRTLVNARMEALGYRKIIIHGARYYSGATLRKNLPGMRDRC